MAAHFTVTRRDLARVFVSNSASTLFERLLEYGEYELVLQTRRTTLELDQGLQAENEDSVPEISIRCDLGSRAS